MKYFLSLVLFVFLIIYGCKKDRAEIPINNFVHFPIGQKSVNDSSLIIEADSVIKDYLIIDDDFGGRWVRIAFRKLNHNSVVSVKFLVQSKPLVLTEQPIPIPDIWTIPSTFIDCDHPALLEKALHLTSMTDNINEKAKSIQLFVNDYVRFAIYKDSGQVPASETLELQYGTCINYARLFVALCRSIGIPSRSVWGALNTGGSSYKSHHNWAEFIGSDGNWHPVGLSYTKLYDLNDIRYLDLLYAPEENYHCEEFKMFTISPEGDYFFYDGSGSAVDGKLNAETIVDHFPDEMEISMSYAISSLFEN